MLRHILTALAATFVAGSAAATTLSYTATMNFGDDAGSLYAPAPGNGYARARVTIDALFRIGGNISCEPGDSQCWGDYSLDYYIYSNDDVTREELWEKGRLSEVFEPFDEGVCERSQGCRGHHVKRHRDSAEHEYQMAEFPFIARNGMWIEFGNTGQGWLPSKGRARVTVSYEGKLSPMPIPATLPLLGAGIGMILLLRRRRAS